MPIEAAPARRRIRLTVYAVFFLFFGLIVFLSHSPFLRLPYYWDEAGYYVPAALDLFRGWHWIPHSTTPNVHPPLVLAYLSAAWRIAGFHPAVTRSAMLLLGSLGALCSFLLAIELSREVKGRPAFLTAALVCATPLFVSQAMMAQLEAPAMLLTSLALLLFVQDRVRLSAAVCVLLVLVKETGIVVPLVFAGWLAWERRWRDLPWFAAPAGILGAWIGAVALATGHWTGTAEYAQYNMEYSAHPVRFGLALLRRIYYLFFANFHWVGTIAIVYAWRTSRIFHSRSWRVAWMLVGAHVAVVSLLGGAVLERYVLPVVPIVYAAMTAGISLYRGTAQLVASLALLAGVAAGNFINPPYPFPYEDNLAFTDFVKLHVQTAEYLSQVHRRARVSTAWPMNAELSQPDLGFVERGMRTRTIEDFSERTLRSLDWSQVQVLVVYSRVWDPGVLRTGFIGDLRRRLYGYEASLTRENARTIIPLPVEAQFERRGQWVDVYVNPAAREGAVTEALAQR
jgi:hypothetical protein